jgi:hypothetical protein
MNSVCGVADDVRDAITHENCTCPIADVLVTVTSYSAIAAGVTHMRGDDKRPPALGWQQLRPAGYRV